MNRRCYDKNFEGYPLYGGRGITVCKAWRTFEGFWADMGATWQPKLTIDRIDVNGNYEPGNCRWATTSEQGKNKRNTIVIETPWGRMTRQDAAKKAGISVGCLIHRMTVGWPPELWLSTSQRSPRD